MRLMNTNPDTYNLVLIAAGLAIGLFGWLLYWAGIPLIGGLVGACGGGALGVFASDFVQTPWALPLFMGVGVTLGAILGVILMKAIQLYFFFATGASLGGVMTWRLIHHTGLGDYFANTPGWGVMAAVAIGAILGGFILVKFRRFIVAVITSIVGVVVLSAGLPARFQGIGMVITAIVFLCAQIGLVRRFVQQQAFDERMQRYRRQREEIEAER